MWAAIIQILLGIWIAAAPVVFNMNKTASDHNYIAGPLVITFAIIALWEVNRNVIKMNILVGVWLCITPFIGDIETSTANISNIATGIIIIMLSFVKRRVKENYGGGWASLFQKYPVHMLGKRNEE